LEALHVGGGSAYYMNGMRGFDVVKMGRTLTRLQGFELTYCMHVKDSELLEGLCCCPSLRGLNLEGCSHIDGSVIVALASAPFRMLFRYLNIASTGLTRSCMHRILGHGNGRKLLSVYIQNTPCCVGQKQYFEAEAAVVGGQHLAPNVEGPAVQVEMESAQQQENQQVVGCVVDMVDIVEQEAERMLPLLPLDVATTCPCLEYIKVSSGCMAEARGALPNCDVEDDQDVR
jgi:hypothetical protein